jgi:hypothetical protein
VTTERPQIEQLSKHVHDSYRRFYPLAEHDDLVKAIESSEPIDTNIAARLVGRRYARSDSAYLLHKERTGLFAIANGVVITFLRFYSYSQHQLAVTLFGAGTEPTADAGWVHLYRELATPEPPAPKETPSVPAFDTLTVSKGAKTALGMNKVQAHGAIYTEIVAGRLHPVGEYLATEPKPFALVVIGEVRIGLSLEGNVIRAVPALTFAEHRVSTRKSQSLKEAAALLREHGWTVTPPAKES